MFVGNISRWEVIWKSTCENTLVKNHTNAAFVRSVLDKEAIFNITSENTRVIFYIYRKFLKKIIYLICGQPEIPLRWLEM